MAIPATYVITTDTLAGVEVTPLESCDYETLTAIEEQVKTLRKNLEAEAETYN